MKHPLKWRIIWRRSACHQWALTGSTDAATTRKALLRPTCPTSARLPCHGSKVQTRLENTGCYHVIRNWTTAPWPSNARSTTAPKLRVKLIRVCVPKRRTRRFWTSIGRCRGRLLRGPYDVACRGAHDRSRKGTACRSSRGASNAAGKYDVSFPEPFRCREITAGTRGPSVANSPGQNGNARRLQLSGLLSPRGRRRRTCQPQAGDSLRPPRSSLHVQTQPFKPFPWNWLGCSSTGDPMSATRQGTRRTMMRPFQP